MRNDRDFLALLTEELTSADIHLRPGTLAKLAPVLWKAANWHRSPRAAKNHAVIDGTSAPPLELDVAVRQAERVSAAARHFLSTVPKNDPLAAAVATGPMSPYSRLFGAWESDWSAQLRVTREAVQQLYTLANRRAAMVQKKSPGPRGRTSRRMLCHWTAHQLALAGVPLTTTRTGPFVRILQIVLTVAGYDRRSPSNVQPDARAVLRERALRVSDTKATGLR